MQPDPLNIIDIYYSEHPKARKILLEHSRSVANKALDIARMASSSHLHGLDHRFIEEAALLHDIGMLHTHAPMLGCHGTQPYICHGVIGRDMLEAHKLHSHALVCERHIGMGLTPEDIRRNAFPIPERQMLPLTPEEKIVCFADKFFSKLNAAQELPYDHVRASMARYGQDKLIAFDNISAWLRYQA